MDFKKDYYSILELKPAASKEEIRAAYRRLAKLYHPDKNPGDHKAGERFKEVNEANEILSNEILRHEYDTYHKLLKEWEQAREKEKAAESALHKRTYQRKRTLTREVRIYIKGEVKVKYWASPEEDVIASFQNEAGYKITPTGATVDITQTDIHTVQAVPLYYLRAFKESELFRSPIPNPVRCIIKTPGKEECYDLELKDIRIKNIRLDAVTKHEKQSFGTLTGEIYAYAPKLETYEVVEQVTECFGETGRVDTKTEEGISYYRKEYYHPDCTVYWGSWYTAKTNYKAKATKQTPSPVMAQGCMQWWWIPVLLLFIILVPKLLILFLVLLGVGLLFSFGSVIGSLSARILPVLGTAVFLLFLVSAIRSFSAKSKPYVRKNKPSYDSLGTVKKRVRKQQDRRDTTQSSADSLIGHYIRWNDYNDSTFETNLAISIVDLNSSIAVHRDMNPFFNSNTLAPVYTEMLLTDENRLHYVYDAFDSIRKANRMDEVSFSRLIVSCVQSVPYYLVVDRGCGDKYDDEYTKKFLAQCNSECCIGYEKFGVRSPVEFLSDLKGDCDTRSLLLYQIMKHFKYDVALLTSQYYKHAMIAVHFSKDADVTGLAKSIRDRNYYLWETTGAGFNAGSIPENLQNLDYWEVALLNENN